MSFYRDAFEFHVAYITLLRFSEESRQLHIAIGGTVLEYLSVRFEKNSAISHSKSMISHIDRLRDLHNSLSSARKEQA